MLSGLLPQERETSLKPADAQILPAQPRVAARLPEGRGLVLPGLGDMRPVTGAVARLRSLSPLKLSFLLVVVLPTVIAALYAFFWASNRYVSEFRVAVRAVEPIKTGGLADLFGLGGFSQAGNDSNAVVQYLQSREAFEQIQQRFPLEKKFSDHSIDWFSRFTGRPDIERLTRYWDSMIDAYFETSTGTVIVRASGFSAQDAYAIARLMLADSEALINRMSKRARDDSVAFAEKEVSAAEARLEEVRKKARALQDKEAILDPMKSAEVNITLTAKLREQIAQQSAELATQKLRLSPTAPSVRASEESIAGLKRELQRIRAEATAARGSRAAVDDSGAARPLSTVFGAFQQLADEKTFAEKAYLSALAALETARLDANRQQVYLSTIVPPGLPQEAAFPRPLRQTGITFLIAAALWLIALMGVYSVREHM
ncbi:hypothetical protein K9U39_18530 [Rhodoblastus acidophilus]|uniref:Capsule biosynthesis protein n=1 Tax=Candidatus Rhodoblastus alkanivorans TaxID=2954117 RepID=A0ABS9Z337_9HYPH|nr:hypothetical protein [Candidatus Rhodoblastus alkanivorans]MCI4677496.1 hypothetical protein [Candidatus Rhodoblastus alkanivorans]MCI4681855.1 hypothetical protein [Candidatus Rhodoblastus alkanivorans]MDI4642905.1 hypothetical protein [Rhodoblastus acidophilus]